MCLWGWRVHPTFTHAGDFFGEVDIHQRDRKVRVWHRGLLTRLDGRHQRDGFDHQRSGTPPPPSHNPYFPLISTPHIAHSPGQPNPAGDPFSLHPHTAPPCTSSLDTLKNLDPLTPALFVCAGTDRTIPAAAVLPRDGSGGNSCTNIVVRGSKCKSSCCAGGCWIGGGR